jgi:oleate hydratase
MEAVYTLLNVERGVPEVFNSTYDIRMLLSAIGSLRDGKEIDLPITVGKRPRPGARPQE